MDLKSHINKDQHAYLVCGGVETLAPRLQKTIEEVFGIKTVGNPDYRVRHFEILGIGEARELKEEQGRRAFSGEEKFFIVSADAITREAQNALLKVFEEPTKGTYIFLVMANVRQILPTLLSRVRVLRPMVYGPQSMGINAEELFKTSVEKRFQIPFVKKIIEEKDKQALIYFFDEIELFLHENLPMQKSDKATREFLTELIKFRGYAGDRSSSVKMLMEHVALMAPVI
jgi:hypothetical protein